MKTAELLIEKMAEEFIREKDFRSADFEECRDYQCTADIKLINEALKEAYLKGSTSSMRWIPIDEALPDMERSVVFCTRYGSRLVGMRVEEVVGDYWWEDASICDECSSIYRDNEVISWCYLPD